MADWPEAAPFRSSRSAPEGACGAWQLRQEWALTASVTPPMLAVWLAVSWLLPDH